MVKIVHVKRIQVMTVKTVTYAIYQHNSLATIAIGRSIATHRICHYNSHLTERHKFLWCTCNEGMYNYITYHSSVVIQNIS